VVKHRPKPHTPGWALLAAAVAVVSGIVGSGFMVWTASEAAFSATTVNPMSSWTAGTVSLTDDDAGTAVFTAVGLRPGTTASKCTRVTYGGDISSGDVKIYSAAPTGTLGTYVTMTVEVGTVGAFAGCGAFSASSTAINGIALATVGTKTNYSTGYSSGWSPAAGESRVFKFTYTLSASTPDAQQGTACTMPFTWETQTT
jgi:hypothetical protein